MILNVNIAWNVQIYSSVVEIHIARSSVCNDLIPKHAYEGSFFPPLPFNFCHALFLKWFLTHLTHTHMGTMF